MTQCGWEIFHATTVYKLNHPLTHTHTQDTQDTRERSIDTARLRAPLLSELNSSVLLSGCVIKVLSEGWGSHGSSGLHM